MKRWQEKMKIILRKDYESLGKAGEIITVKDGYARNYLIPQGIAVLATPKFTKILIEERKTEERRQEKDRNKAKTMVKELEKISITAAVPVGDEDRVFGSVTTQTIAELLKEKGYDIDKRKILLENPIKALGVYTVPIKFHSDIEAKVRIWVVKE